MKRSLSRNISSLVYSKRSVAMGLNQRFGKSLHFSKLEKIVIAITISAILLVSALGFLVDEAKPVAIDNLPIINDPTASPLVTPQITLTPAPTSTPVPTAESPPQIKNPFGGAPIITPEPQKQPGLFETAPYIGSQVWKAVAQNAWAYFQPGRGIDSTTGLPAGALGWNQFTDWDLGVYIEAVINAEKLGLISKDGAWGASARLGKVLNFLETRELNSTTKVPYWFYYSDGTGYLDQTDIDLMDTGTLLVALNNLKIYEPTFASRIDNFVYNTDNNRTNYSALVPFVKSTAGFSSIYSYYCASGFALFWPDELYFVPDQILNNMYSGNVTTYNVTLPRGDLTCEPLLYAYFNLDHNTRIEKLVNDTYLAHEAKYNATGKYVAFSEGNSPSCFVWGWVVTAGGDKWVISDGQKIIDVEPVIFNKISTSFLSIFNSTFARDMSVYLERVCPEPTKGYCDGADYKENKALVSVVGSIGCNTNGLILSAAAHALST